MRKRTPDRALAWLSYREIDPSLDATVAGYVYGIGASIGRWPALGVVALALLAAHLQQGLTVGAVSGLVLFAAMADEGASQRPSAVER